MYMLGLINKTRGEKENISFFIKLHIKLCATLDAHFASMKRLQMEAHMWVSAHKEVIYKTGVKTV